MHQRIFLTGFMGAGKSSVGRMLAPRLELPFFDLDRVVEQRLEKSIPQIFAEHGEAYFRECELESVQTLDAGVIALGGGAFVQEPIRSWTLAQGIVIFIDWPFEVLYRRVRNSKHRPLVKSKDELYSLFEQRYAHYQKATFAWRSAAPYRESVKQVVKSIQRKLRELASNRE